MKLDQFDDFPVSSVGNADAKDLYQSYLEFEILLAQVPRKYLGNNPGVAEYDLFREVHTARTAQGALYRRRLDANEALGRLWLSRIRQQAQLLSASTELAPFDGLSVDDLADFARLSADPEKLSSLQQLLLDKGIVVIYEPSIPSMKLDGAVFCLDDGHPVIGLSLRYPRLDIFWFTLMHELAHIVLHRELLTEPILEDLDAAPEGLVEEQADRLAGDSLISRSAWRSANVKYSPTEENLFDFARRVGVHPAIVAGRLQRESAKKNMFAKILNEVNVRRILFGHE
ncbi:HTH-type transcriptional regulator / antitoxin HigA [Burkholderia sp. WP9]|uniref:ImmA/IrrE family metallo-endopeptidase n=1 Tax=Burkholderia sp. WP9 TaxID=1500263 RepID=UPI000897B199|nr:ImmA/IrrE family metallo-endopeptidase [Burkholderia sp. WP9]SED24953.1 HTH-type transcriptional regulator / antitoxin HigA [Burkholderia sp. WP9]